MSNRKNRSNKANKKKKIAGWRPAALAAAALVGGLSNYASADNIMPGEIVTSSTEVQHHAYSTGGINAIESSEFDVKSENDDTQIDSFVNNVITDSKNDLVETVVRNENVVDQLSENAIKDAIKELEDEWTEFDENFENESDDESQFEDDGFSSLFEEELEQGTKENMETNKLELQTINEEDEFGDNFDEHDNDPFGENFE